MPFYSNKYTFSTLNSHFNETMIELKKARVFAFYLPQFHPIPENDLWWGKGFTEWTNVGKAKRLFRNHYQPRVPSDLGYYDLRVPEIRKEQAQLAKEHGIEGFIYWHYWFGNGKRLLQRPFNEILSDDSFDFPFALAWANESWKGNAHGLSDEKVLITQQYPSQQDFVNHFINILPALKDSRYIRINGKPLFMIYKPNDLPNVRTFIQTWNSLAYQNGLPGIYFVAHHSSRQEYFGDTYENSLLKIQAQGFDALNIMRLKGFIENNIDFSEHNYRLINGPLRYSYKKAYPFFSAPIDCHPHVIPCIISGWDNTPRHPQGLVLTNYSPALFDAHIKDVLSHVAHKQEDERIIILKSWNEWAEGNYVEPDLKWGHSFLETIQKNLLNN
jgi:hypothetical protein